MSVRPADRSPSGDRLARPRPASVQAAAIRRTRGSVAVPVVVVEGRDYAGLVTRTIALAIDGAIVNGSAALVGVVFGLGVSVLHLPARVDAVIAAIGSALWVIWSISYFSFFWSSTGQTPGARVMRIRVVLDGRGRGPIGLPRAALRFAGLVLAAIPLLAGFLIMLWDERRRCLQDRIARTVVVYAPPPRIVDRVLARASSDRATVAAE